MNSISHYEVKATAISTTEQLPDNIGNLASNENRGHKEDDGYTKVMNDTIQLSMYTEAINFVAGNLRWMKLCV